MMKMIIIERLLIVQLLLFLSLALDTSANTAPIALSELIVVDSSSSSIVVRLRGYDQAVNNVSESKMLIEYSHYS